MRRLDLTPLLLLIPLLLALLPDGLPNTADMHVHFIRAAEMVHAWEDGILLPRWSENLGYGYGIPLFNYAPPLPYLITALLHTVGLSLELALKGTLVIALLLAAWGSYLLIRSSFGVLAGATGSVAFVYAPYRLRELFIQGNVGQFLAWSFIPWAVWGVARLWATGKVRYGVVVALAVAGALLSHNVVALVLGAVLVFQSVGLVILTLLQRNQPTVPWAPRLSQVSLAGIGGFALAAWFSIPALLEGEFIQLDKIVASDYRTRFVSLQELIALSPPLDRAAVNPYLPLTLGAVQVELGLLGIVLFFILQHRGKQAQPEDRQSSSPWGYVLLAGAGAFMAHRLSLPLWEQLPFVDLFEFPARWHGFTALGLAGMLGAGIAAINARSSQWGAWAGGIAIGLVWLSSLVNLYPQRLPLGTLHGNPADVVQFEVSTGAVGTTSLAEFNPRWRTIPLTDSPLLEDYRTAQLPQRIEQASLPAGARAETVASDTQSHALRVTLTEPATITLNLLYFPGWRAQVNGVLTPLSPQTETGLIQMAVPAGDSEIALRFDDTPLRQMSAWLSFTGWGALLLICAIRARGYRPTFTQFRPRVTASRVALASLVPIVVLYGVAGSYFAPTSPLDTVLSVQKPLRADWGEELRLLGADLPNEVLKAGTTATVAAYVRPLQPLTENYAVYLHLDDPTGQTVATSDQRHPAEIPIANVPTSLYVRIPFEIAIPPDLPPMRYTWRLGWHNPESQTPLLLADGQKDVELGALWLESAETPTPQGATATFGDAIQLRGATLNEDHTLTLYWEATVPITEEVTIFVHLLDANGQNIGQADGDPFGNRYPLPLWRSRQIFAETRTLPSDIPYESVAIGIYRRGDGTRLPAIDGAGGRLANDALVVEAIYP